MYIYIYNLYIYIYIYIKQHLLHYNTLQLETSKDLKIYAQQFDKVTLMLVSNYSLLLVPRY